MNKLLYLFLLTGILTQAQTFGPQQIISTEGNGPESLFVADLNGDLYPDVMTANRLGSELLWFKNNGDGTFGPKQTIATLNQPIDIYAADIDGDNDMDILSLSTPDNILVWYENIGGLGNFGPQQTIANDAFFATTLIAADIDGDNEMDVISGTDGTGLIWYENIDGNGTFGPKIQIASLPSCRSVFAGDIDGDNDLDLVAVASGSENLFWFENLDGQGNFGPPQFVATTTTFVNTVYCKDLDGDDDLDIVTAIPANDIIAWHENLDGLGSFGNEQIITNQANFAIDVIASDFDNDNDNDVLFAAPQDDKVAWQENIDGLGTFSSQQLISTNSDGVKGVFAADLDLDGDMDVLSVSLLDDKVAWYENLTILNRPGFSIPGLKVYPNPAEEILVIDSPVPIKKVTIYTALGKSLLEASENCNEISLETLPNGLLLVDIETESGKVTKKILKE